MNTFEKWLNDELKGLKDNLKHGAFNNAITINTLEEALVKHHELCEPAANQAEKHSIYVEGYMAGLQTKDKEEAYQKGRLEAAKEYKTWCDRHDSYTCGLKPKKEARK